MSEAELHILKARLRGGLLNKARRGELKMPLPAGLVYDPLDRVVLDPDAQVRNSCRILFDTFMRTGSARATVRYFTANELQIPHRPRSGPDKGELHWKQLTHWRVLQMLHNPRYAGAFAYGRSRQLLQPDGRIKNISVPRQDWIALHPGKHAGYISWDRFEANLGKLLENARAHGSERRQGPPREGPALLQGLAVCGACGGRMTVRYHTRQGRLVPDYLCQREGITHAGAICQRIPGAGIDRAVGTLLVERMTPVTLEVALRVQAELAQRADEAEAWRSRQVQRARQEADLARQRYRQVDPGNRLVADVLEAEWNACLRELEDAQRECERKRMARLLIEDVTMTKGEGIALGVRLRGGATEPLALPLEPRACDRYRTPAGVVAEIDALLEDYTAAAVARILNDRGRRPLKGGAFSAERVQRVRRTYGLKPRCERLRARGLLDLKEMAERLGVTTGTVKKWRDRELLTAHVCNDKGECLYEWPDEPPKPQKRASKASPDMQTPGVPADRSNEVQYEL